MNQLWVRMSAAFAFVLIVSSLLVALVFQLNDVTSDVPPPPEVVAYFEQIRQERVAPNPFLTLILIGGVATAAGIIFSRFIAAPMSALEDAATDLGQGDLGKRVDPRGSQEMIAVAEAFNTMAEQLEQSESLRQSMLSDVAHELRHPLHVLQGNLQAIQDGIYPINEEEIERLIAQVHHLTVMVEDLHVLTQAEARRLPLQIQNVDIAELVKDIAAIYQPTATSNKIDLHVELLGTMPPSVAIDKARIRQAVQNLLENAMRHTAVGDRIILTVRPTNDKLTIEIRDTGEGIAQDQLPLVFDRLYRGDPARQRKDGDRTGLGLAITKAIVDAHGGDITVQSPGIDQGSTFTIHLPLKTMGYPS